MTNNLRNISHSNSSTQHISSSEITVSTFVLFFNKRSRTALF